MMREYSIDDWISNKTMDPLRFVTVRYGVWKFIQSRTSLFSNIIQSNKTLFTTTCNYRRNKTSNHTDKKIIFYVNSPRESYLSIDTTARYDGLRQMLRRVLPYRSEIIHVDSFLPRCNERFEILAESELHKNRINSIIAKKVNWVIFRAE